MALEDYQKKRDFRKTNEPKAKDALAREGDFFVVQKHDASSLHYDFRLAHNGVLKSWAIPKGPSLDPADKRLAVQVEDHPLDYADFEGVIPEGEYGGGTVMVWDRGDYDHDGDMSEALDKGQVKVQLHGEKMKGNWALVQMKGKRSGGGKNWLLIKERDEQVDRKHKDRLTEKANKSAKTGRSMQEIKRDEKSDPQIAGVEITHPDKELFPDAEITKLDLAHYYEAVADWILPDITDRPLTLLRCPSGRQKSCFYQKHPSKSLPDQIGSVEIEEKNGDKKPYIRIESPEELIALVQLGTIEMHTWSSRADKLEKPDRLVFDLDPGEGVSFDAVMDAARLLRDRLQDFDMQAFVKTSGGKGLHVIVPLVRRNTWDEATAFSRAIAKQAAEKDDKFLAEASREKRKGKIFIDYLRTTRGGVCVAAYSVRARKGAPVSVPLRWQDLKADLEPARYTIENTISRLKRLKSDPWKDYGNIRQSITKSMKKDLGI
ncbi:MAG: non-homologous end-joining DNA ligase [Candidatus Sumerlaeia bacterium]